MKYTRTVSTAALLLVQLPGAAWALSSGAAEPAGMHHRTSDRAQAQQERVEDMWATMSAILVNGRDAKSAESYWYCDQPYQEEGSANDFFTLAVFEDGTLQVKSSQDEQVIGWRYLDKEQFPTIQLDSALGIHPFTTYFESKID